MESAVALAFLVVIPEGDLRAKKDRGEMYSPEEAHPILAHRRAQLNANFGYGLIAAQKVYADCTARQSRYLM